jgi:ABC-type sugar transport system ATPase subunit
MIRLEGLRVRAGEFSLAIDDLSVATGEYVMVLGPTAAGKTVLLETVAGLRRPREGRISFGEREVTMEPPERRGVGLVYQDYALFPHLTVAENIAFGRSPRRGPESRSRRARGPGGFGRRHDRPEARELAALLGLEGLLSRYPEGLSGGEQQRVALARALAMRPEVLLLDEPLAALDGPTRSELQRALIRVHQELEATVLHVTHDLDEALALGQRVAVLVGGALRQVGSSAEVTLFPADVEVARLVRSGNLFVVASAQMGSADAGSGCRIRLENGLELLSREGRPLPRSQRVSAVVRADEITLEPLEEVSEPVSAAFPSMNVLEGRVSAIQVQSGHVTVQVDVRPSSGQVQAAAPEGTEPRPGGQFRVHLLRPDLERKGLAMGTPVRMLIPPASVHLCAGAPSQPVVSLPALQA